MSEPDWILSHDLDRLALQIESPPPPSGDPLSLASIVAAFAERAGIDITEAERVCLAVIRQRALGAS